MQAIMRLCVAAIVAANAMAAVPATASATGTISYSARLDRLIWTDSAGSSSRVVVAFLAMGAGAADDRTRLTASPGAVTIAASAAAICTASGTFATCRHNDPARPADELEIRAGDGADTTALVRGVGATQPDHVRIGGGPGHDTLGGSPGRDTIHGDGGNDTINAAAGDDWTMGDAGNDTIDGGPGHDNNYGGSGDDWMIVRVDGATDGYFGGEGGEVVGDFVDYSRIPAGGVTVSVTTGSFDDGPDGEWIDDSIENVNGTGAADSLSGDGQVNRLLGGAGDDLLDGGAGGDTITGFAGDDVLVPGSGVDAVAGGPGDDVIRLAPDGVLDTIDGGEGGETLGDTVSFALAAVGVLVTLGDQTGNDANDGENLGDTIENLEGSQHADRMTGDAAGNTITGLGGADVLSGWHGDDTIRGGQGDDQIVGGPGNDLLVGGGGANRIEGGPGDDTVNARNRTADTIRCGDGADTVNADRVDTVAGDCEVVNR